MKKKYNIRLYCFVAFILYSFCIFSPSSLARIRSEFMYSISDDARIILDKITPGSIVLINIDKVISTPKSAMFSISSRDRNFIKTLETRSISNPSLDKIIASWFFSRRLELIDEKWPEFIRDMKKKGAIVLGIDTIHTGIKRFIKNPEGEMLRDLNQLGISFSQEVVSRKYMNLSNIISDRAFFYEGVLFTGELTQAETIKNFLKATILFPPKVIVISSYKPQSVPLINYLRKSNINTNLVLYKGWFNLRKDVRLSVVKLQQKSLLMKSVWLEDEQAEKLLTKK